MFPNKDSRHKVFNEAISSAKEKQGLELLHSQLPTSATIPSEDCIPEIDEKALNELRAYLEARPDLLQCIKEGNQRIQAIQLWELSSRQDLLPANAPGTRIVDLLRTYPDILNMYSPFSAFSDRGDLKWEQTVRLASPMEMHFLKQGRKVADGLFTEVCQICAYNEKGRVVNNYAVGHSGGFNDDVYKTVEELRGRKDLLGVWMVHSHFDALKCLRLPSTADGNYRVRGLLVSGRIGTGDVQFGNNVYKQYVERSCPVKVMAISEKGVTYTYEAGTSVEFTTD